MLWLQRDAAATVRADLRKVIPDKGAVQAMMPAGWTPRDGPVCTVVSDGTPITNQGFTKELVRVTVRAHDGPTARRILTDIDGYLLTPAMHRWGYSISPSTGIIAGPDSRLGGWMASAVYGITMNRKVASDGTENRT